MRNDRQPYARAISCAAALGLLSLVDLLTGGVGGPDALGAAVLVGFALAGEWHARRSEDRLLAMEARLAAIDREAGRSEPDSADARAGRRLDVLREALVVAAATAGAERAVLWDADIGLRRIAARMASDGVVTGGWLPFAGTPLGWLAEQGQPLRFDARPPVTARFAIVLAVRLSDGPIPTLLTLEYVPSAEPPEPDALEPVATQVQTALDGLSEQIAQVVYRERVSILLAALRRIPESIDPASFTRDLIRDAMRLTNARGGAVATWQDDVGTILGVEGELGGPDPGATFEPGQSELALAARAEAPMVQDLTAKRVGPSLIAAPDERWHRRPGYLASVPLPVAGEPAGLLAVWSTEPLDPQGADLLRSLAPLAGSQLAHSLEFGRVRETAERDALTGLPNRRAFDRVFDHERLRLARYEHPLALLVTDIDHFKSVNDTWGHEAGDAILMGVAESLRDTLRDVDTIARFGGEEFVALLPETSLEPAIEAAERLRAAVEARAFFWNGEAVPVRVSVGVSACPDCVLEADDLMRSADAALYQAKGNGRNRIEHAPRAPKPRPQRRWDRR